MMEMNEMICWTYLYCIILLHIFDEKIKVCMYIIYQNVQKFLILIQFLDAYDAYRTIQN